MSFNLEHNFSDTRNEPLALINSPSIQVCSNESLTVWDFLNPANYTYDSRLFLANSSVQLNGTFRVIASLSGVSECYSIYQTRNGDLYVATGNSNGDVFKSVDGGANWANTANLPGVTVVYGAFIQADNGTLFVRTAGNMFKTTDNGSSWQDTGQNFAGGNIIKLQDGSILVAQTGSTTFYKSTNNGSSWNPAGSIGGGQVGIMGLYELQNGSILAGTRDGAQIHISHDGGASWNYLATLSSESYVWGFLETNNGTWFCGASDQGKVYKSIDNGSNWIDSSQGINPSAVQVSSFIETPSHDIIAATNSEPIISSDHGLSWKQFSSATGDFRSYNALILAQNGSLYGADDTSNQVYIFNFDTSAPIIQPKNSYKVGMTRNITDFIEVGNNYGQNTDYQLSSDEATYYYWNGTFWAPTTTEWSNATIIDTNIQSFPIPTGNLSIKIRLGSDGSSTPKLDKIILGLQNATAPQNYSVNIQIIGDSHVLAGFFEGSRTVQANVTTNGSISHVWAEISNASVTSVIEMTDPDIDNLYNCTWDTLPYQDGYYNLTVKVNLTTGLVDEDSLANLLIISSTEWVMNLWNYTIGTPGDTDLISDDINNDGNNEIIFATRLPNPQVGVIFNNGTKYWNISTVSNYDFADSNFIALGNISDSPNLHIFYALKPDPVDVVILNYDSSQNNTIDISGDCLSIATGNIDNDPYDELVAGGQGHLIDVYDHNGSFLWTQGVGDTVGMCVMGEITGDNKNEILFTTYSADRRLYTYNSNGSTQLFTVLPNSGFGGFPVIGDIDGDGINDIAWGPWSGVASTNFYTVKNNGSILWARAGWERAMHIYDIDIDGANEIITKNSTSIYVYKNDSTLLWQYPTGSPFIGKFLLPNKANMIILNSSHVLFIGLNGDIVNVAPLPSPFTPLLGSQPNNKDSATVNDFNNDGLDDIVYYSNGRLICLSFYPGSDITPPQVSNPSPVNGVYTYNSTPSISVNLMDTYSGVNASTITFTVEGVVRSHSWDGTTVSWTAGAPFANGQVINVSVIASDNAGNAMTPYSWAFTIDTSPPQANNPSPLDSSYTNNTTPTISVELTDALSDINASTITFTVEGIVRSHSWDGTTVSWTAGAPFANGQVINISLSVYDNAGNAMTSYSWAFTIDTSPPQANNPSPLDSSYTNNTTPTISVELTDALSDINASTITFTVEGVVRSHSWDGTTVSWTAGAPFANGQVINVSLDALDNASNVMSTYSWSFTIDDTPPQASNPSPLDSSYINDTTPTISVELTDALSDLNTSSITLTVEGVVRSHSWDGTTVNWSAGAPFVNGQEINVSLDALDNAGNAMPTYSWAFTIETTPFSNFSILGASTTFYDSTPTVICRINVSGAGINLSSVQYAYSTNGSLTPINWASVDGIFTDMACTNPAINGATGLIYIRVTAVPFNQYSLTANTIRFRASDLVGNQATQSIATTIKISEELPPDNTIIIIIIIIVIGAIAAVGVFYRTKRTSLPLKKVQHYIETAKTSKIPLSMIAVAINIELAEARESIIQLLKQNRIIGELKNDVFYIKKTIKGVKPSVDVKRQYDYVGGGIRFKVVIENNSDMVITQISIFLSPGDQYETEKPVKQISTLQSGGTRGVDFNLIPRSCGKSKITGSVNYLDAYNEIHTLPIKPLEIWIKNPLVIPKDFTEEEIKQFKLNTKENIANLPLTNISSGRAFELAKDQISSLDLKEIDIDLEETFFAIYGGVAKITGGALVIEVNGIDDGLIIKLWAQDQKQATGLLAHLQEIILKSLTLMDEPFKWMEEKINSIYIIMDDLIRLFGYCEDEKNTIQEKVSLLNKITVRISDRYKEMKIYKDITSWNEKISSDLKSEVTLDENTKINLEFEILQWVTQFNNLKNGDIQLYQKFVDKSPSKSEILRKSDQLTKTILELERQYSLNILKLVLIIYKTTGVELFSHQFIDLELDSDILSGVLTALQAISLDITKVEKPMRKMEYHGLMICFETGKYIRVALMLSGKVTDYLTNALQKLMIAFEEKYQKELPTWTAEVGIFSDFEQELEPIFQFVETVIEPTIEEKIQNVNRWLEKLDSDLKAGKITKDKYEPYVSNLLIEKKELEEKLTFISKVFHVIPQEIYEHINQLPISTEQKILIFEEIASVPLEESLGIIDEYKTLINSELDSRTEPNENRED